MTYFFGIEIEALLSLRQKPPGGYPDIDDVNAFAMVFIPQFNASTDGRRMHSIVLGYNGPPAPEEWLLTDDATLDATDESNQYMILTWGVEIISPVLEYLPGVWRKDIRTMWDDLRICCDVRTNETCGTHVHISPGLGTPWTLESLKRICRGLIHFENAFEALVPKERRQLEYAKSIIHDNPKLRGKAAEAFFALINECTTNEAISELLNPNRDRYYSWNFTNLLQGGKATIEFRRGPGMVDEEECFSWAELAVLFVKAADNLSSLPELKSYSANIQGLLAFITRGLQPNATSLQHVRRIFVGKSGSLVPIPIGALSAARQAKLARKKAKDDKKNSILMERMR